MERWKTLEVAASWSETKNTWPSILGSFDLIIVVRERAENDNFFRVRTQVKNWYFTPKSQHLSTHVRIYKLIHYPSQEVRTVHYIWHVLLQFRLRFSTQQKALAPCVRSTLGEVLRFRHSIRPPVFPDFHFWRNLFTFWPHGARASGA